MMLFRKACTKDLEGLFNLAQKSEMELTTLPKDLKLLKQRLHLSNQSFKKDVQEPTDEYYLFVLEDMNSQQIIGTSAIEARTGYDAPFYAYHISKYTRTNHSLNKSTEYELLNLVNDYEGRSELCTLFLDPAYRQKKYGAFLSKARFLFMKQNAERFMPNVIAQLRGITNEHNESPFWDHVGRHFFKMSFADADRLVLASDKQFIEDLMPQIPLYVPLLDASAQEVIGKPGTLALPALNFLLKEGFHLNKYVHIFDAGPIVEAPLLEIKTAALSTVRTIKTISDEVQSPDYLIAEKTHCSVTTGGVLMHDEDESCIIDKKTAKTLKVHCGDKLLISPMHFEEAQA